MTVCKHYQIFIYHTYHQLPHLIFLITSSIYAFISKRDVAEDCSRQIRIELNPGVVHTTSPIVQCSPLHLNGPAVLLNGESPLNGSTTFCLQAQSSHLFSLRSLALPTALLGILWLFLTCNLAGVVPERREWISNLKLFQF